MLHDQPDLAGLDCERDMDLWRHLFHPEDLVRVGDVTTQAAGAQIAEYCSGNVWRNQVIEGTIAICWPAFSLLRGATCKEPMTRGQLCEAVLGRLRAARVEIVMVVEDGDGGLECWIDPDPGNYPIPSMGRCPGGVSSRTGRPHRVLWAHSVTRIAWDQDDWSP
jgi:hypothetical protein